MRIASVGYLITTTSGKELIPNGHYSSCFGEASNIAIDEAKIRDIEVHIVALSLAGTTTAINERRGSREWERVARVITTDMLIFRQREAGRK